MNEANTKSLALALLRADSEDAAIDVLDSAGLWDKPEVWRLLDDDENNFKIVGAQQARPEAALVEKLVNAVDARLTDACLRAGINPTSADAPQSIRTRDGNHHRCDRYASTATGDAVGDDLRYR